MEPSASGSGPVILRPCPRLALRTSASQLSASAPAHMVHMSAQHSTQCVPWHVAQRRLTLDEERPVIACHASTQAFSEHVRQLHAGFR